MSIPIVEPTSFIDYCYGDAKRHFQGCTDLLLCYDDSQFDTLIQELRRCHAVRPALDNLFLLKNSHVALAGRFGIGAPATVAKCEELIACGIRRILAVGTAATISKEFGVGKVIVCAKAYSDEGTSRHYFPRRKCFRASPDLARAVVGHLNSNSLPCKTAVAWTTDAPYRETPAKRDAFRVKGASMVEMEASALYMLAAYRNVEAVSVLVVGDSIAGETWEPHFHEESIQTTLRTTGWELLSFLRTRHSKSCL